MRKITENLDISEIVKLKGPHRTTQSVPLDGAGYPVDRTVCPWCYGRERDCRQCSGSGLVCPTCRGARVLSSGHERQVSIVGCHDCTDWIDQSQHHWGVDGNPRWPAFRRIPRREAGVIRHYMSRRGRELAAS